MSEKSDCDTFIKRKSIIKRINVFVVSNKKISIASFKLFSPNLKDKNSSLQESVVLIHNEESRDWKQKESKQKEVSTLTTM